MSIKMNMRTAQKQHLADLLRKIADLIAESSNDQIAVILEVIFKDC